MNGISRSDLEFKIAFMFVVYVSLTMGCVSGQLVGPNQQVDEQLLETVFRYQFENNGSSTRDSADVYCLTVVNYNLSPYFFDRFTDNKPPVIPIENCNKVRNGLVFGIRELRKISETKYLIYGGYYEHAESSTYERYTVIRVSNGDWRVRNSKLIRVS